MDLKNLKSLIKLMVDNGLTEVELQDPQGEKIILRRGIGQSPVAALTTEPFPVAAPPAGAVATRPPTSESAATTSATMEDSKCVPICAPMVGTFYASPSPDAKPFVAPGSKVTPDTVVCIIEAMKVFNEIKAETTGTVMKVLAASGKAVEFGQPLFLIQPE